MGELDILGTGRRATGRVARRQRAADEQAEENAAARAAAAAEWAARHGAVPLAELLCAGGEAGGCYVGDAVPHVHSRIGGAGFPVDGRTGQWLQEREG